jgi:predicted ribosomally synthesized peptide with nif11-like leader
MSRTAAKDFLSRVEADQAFAAELEALKDDPSAALARVHAAGFDFRPDEVRAEFIDRYGSELSPQQLDAIAAGALEDDLILGIEIGGGALAGYVAVAMVVLAL